MYTVVISNHHTMSPRRKIWNLK